MNNSIPKIDILFGINPYAAVIVIIAAFCISFFYYRKTNPVISLPVRIILTSIRFLALSIVLLVLFETVVNIIYSEKPKRKTFVFFDNSRSLSIKNKDENLLSLKSLFNKLEGDESLNPEFFLFGKQLEQFSDSDSITLQSPLTDISAIADFLSSKKDEAASAVIVSDGMVTAGVDPLYAPFPEGLRIFTVGLGDTSTTGDIEIKDINPPGILFPGKSSVINANILSNGFSDNEITVSLFENNALISEVKVKTGADGIYKADFNYTPSSPGVKRLRITASSPGKEKSLGNNSREFPVNVRNNLIRITLIAGSPSKDLSAIKNTLTGNKDFSISSVTYLGNNTFAEKVNLSGIIDSADVFFLIGYPAAGFPSNSGNRIFSAISSSKKPFCILAGLSTDFNELKKYNSYLPAEIKGFTPEYRQVQTERGIAEHILVKNTSSASGIDWEKLSPVSYPEVRLETKPGALILLKSFMNKIKTSDPVLSVFNEDGRKSALLLAQDIWKWKLQSNEGNLHFNLFITNLARFLSMDESAELIRITPSRRIYSSGERVFFTGEAADETLSPVEDAEIIITVASEGRTSSLTMDSEGNGNYSGYFDNPLPGEYTYKATVKYGNAVKTKTGKFFVSATDAEAVNPVLDKNMLKSVAAKSKAGYYDIGNTSGLQEILRKTAVESEYIKTTEYPVLLRDIGKLMAIVILLLSIEWILRKRTGLL